MPDRKAGFLPWGGGHPPEAVPPLKTFPLPGIWPENNRITIEICITIDFAPLKKIPRRKPEERALREPQGYGFASIDTQAS